MQQGRGGASVHISVVGPVYCCDGCLPELHRRVVDAVEKITTEFELVLVDDGSPDDSWATIQRLAAEDPRVRGIQLTRNFGQHHAVTAGLQAARGEWTVVLDCDLQDRPEEIPRLYEKAQEGHLCVMARRQRPRGFSIQRTQSWLFYRVFSYLTDIPYDGTVSNFSIIHRKVLDTINEMGEAIRYYPGLLFWAGFPTGFIDAQHDPRFEGETTYTWSRLLAHAQSIILAHSSKPLMLCVKAGFFVVLLALLGALYLVVRAVVLGSAVMGWPSLMVTILFSTGAIIFTLGIVGLYVGRIFAEVRRRPLFVVRKTTYDE